MEFYAFCLHFEYCYSKQATAISLCLELTLKVLAVSLTQVGILNVVTPNKPTQHFHEVWHFQVIDIQECLNMIYFWDIAHLCM